MNVDLLGDFTTEAIWTMLIVALPIMAVALVAGLVVAIFQALTQIQEMTLTFVPKIILVMISMTFFMPFMFAKMLSFMELAMTNIVNIK